MASSLSLPPPGFAVLFACTSNAIRSPMAAGLLRHFHGERLWVKSAGVGKGDLDPFAVTVMAEIGVDISRHVPRRLDEMEDTSFDLIVALSPEAERGAKRMCRINACSVEVWDTPDPSLVEGSRETVLDAYRQVRHGLLARVLARFPLLVE